MAETTYNNSPEFHKFVKETFGDVAENFRHPYNSIVYDDIEESLYYYGGAYYLWDRDWMSRAVEEERELRAIVGRILHPIGPAVCGPDKRLFLPLKEVGEIVATNEKDMDIDKLYHFAFQVQKIPEDYLPPVAFGAKEISLKAAQFSDTQVGELLKKLAKKDSSFSCAIQYDLETGLVLARYSI